MQIVIDIPDNSMDYIDNYEKGSLFDIVLINAIKNGTPLPKNHGRLIDADAIEYTHEVARSLEDGHNWDELCVTRDEIDGAPTIIEAEVKDYE